MKILVVEDNAANARLADAVLSEYGHTTVTAPTAARAIEALAEAPAPEAILLDINVPGGGLTVLRHVRSTPSLAPVAVIAFTALAMRGDRERFIAEGCDGYIAKPIDVGAFSAQIEAVVRSRRSGLAAGS